MYPILFQLGPITVYSYGFFIALGYLACVSIGLHLGKKDGLDPSKLADLAFYLLVSGFLGARILFIITRFEYFMEHPLEIFYIWQGGLVFFGGLLLATAVCYWYVKKHNLPLWKTMDLACIGVAFAHGMGRIGCFTAGCCHGKACDLPWAVRLDSAHVQENLRNVPIHPTQLYEAILLFFLTGFLYWKWHRRQFPGQIVLLYFMIYPFIRGFVEIFRGDSIRGFVIQDWVSTSQFIGLVVFIVTAFVYRAVKTRTASN